MAVYIFFWKMESYIKLILDFMKEAGEIAILNQNKLNISLKQDESIVTNTDIQISQLFRDRIKPLLNSGHILLDEENLVSQKELFNNNNEYIWTIDPIDGTTTYAAGFPTWAIAISLYKNFEPLLGFIYLPIIGELIYTDSKNSYYVKNVFTNNEVKSKIEPKTHNMNKKSIIMAHRLKNYDINKYTILDFYSAYVLAFYTILGKSVGTFLNERASLWDITATLPFLKSCNLACKNVKTNEEIDKLFDIELNDNWKLKNTYLICNNSNYSDVKSILINVD